MDILFWFCVFGILYAYFGYPLSMYLLSRAWPADIKRWAYNYGSERSVSVVITAANEETRIIDKLNNTLALEYPSDKLQIVIALDAPTDRTGQLVDQWMYDIPAECKVDRVDLGIRGGKEAAQLRALEVVKNDIVVFTDTATRLESHTLYQITSNFCDEHIGAVDGMSKVDSKESSEGLYLRYENKIREWESDTSGLVTFGGCLFAVRREIIEGYYDMLDRAPVPGFRGDRQSDFRTALITKTAGYHSVLDKEAVALFKDGDESKEFGRKHRTIVRGMAQMAEHGVAATT